MEEYQHSSETQKTPSTIGGRVRALLTHIGDNIDLVNLFGRQKDYYKLFEFSTPFVASAFMWLGTRSHKSPEVREMGKKIAEVRGKLARGDISDSDFIREFRKSIKLDEISKKIQKPAEFKANLIADVMNGLTLTGISLISSWIEKRENEQLYGDYVKEEKGLSQRAGFKELRKSKNPIIADATAYYARKSRYRMLPNILSFGRVIPAIVRLFDKNGFDNNPDKYKWARSLAEKWQGIKISNAGWAAYFTWYIVARKTGSHYEFRRIWDKTEGFSQLPNRALSHGAQPGEEVTRGDISTLYGNLVQESHQKSSGLKPLIPLGPNDPLTNKLFDRIASYLNYNYIPKLFTDGKNSIDFDDPDYKNTRFSFRDLLHLMGTNGIDVDNAMTSAVKIEALAHRDRKTYDILSSRLDNIPRPHGRDFATTAEAVKSMSDYLDAVDKEARLALGDDWPPEYIRDENFRQRIIDSFAERELGIKPERKSHPVVMENTSRHSNRHSNNATPTGFSTRIDSVPDHVTRSRSPQLHDATIPAIG